MAQFVKSLVIHAPVTRVFGFHEREDALQLLTPKFPPARLVSKTGGITPGSRVVLQVGFTQWVALHGEFVPIGCSSTNKCPDLLRSGFTATSLKTWVIGRA